MEISSNQNMAAKQGTEDSLRYFRTMSQFLDFNEADAETIKQTRPIVEKHLPEIISKFYSHLNRGGPVCTGTLEGDTLTCPQHGFQYIVTDRQLLVDENAHLDSYRVDLRNGEIHLFIPDY